MNISYIRVLEECKLASLCEIREMLLYSRLCVDSLPSPRQPQPDATYAPPPFKPLISFKKQVWNKSSVIVLSSRAVREEYKCLTNYYEGKNHLFLNTIWLKRASRLSETHIN